MGSTVRQKTQDVSAQFVVKASQACLGLRMAGKGFTRNSKRPRLPAFISPYNGEILQLTTLLSKWDPLSFNNTKKRKLQQKRSRGKLPLNQAGFPPPNEQRHMYYIMVNHAPFPMGPVKDRFTQLARPFGSVRDIGNQ